MSAIRIALVGCGFFGQQLASAFSKAGATLVGVTDINSSLSNKLAEQYHSRSFQSCESMFAEIQADLTLIATPNYAHYSVAISALQAGSHLFIDTPFALSAAHCRHILSLANEKQKQVLIGHLWRTLPGLNKAKNIIAQNKLGTITVVKASRQRWMNHSPNKEWWKYDANLTGGELFHEIHELDLLCWLIGEVDSVYAQAANLVHQDTPDSKDIIQLLLKFKNGILGSLEMGTAYRLQDWGITIHGELGALSINFFSSTVTVNFINGNTEHYQLYEDFEADLSLREYAKGIQTYNAIHGTSPFWLSRAVEIEAESVLTHFTKQIYSPLYDCPMRAVEVAEAAKHSMLTEKRIHIQSHLIY